jgi:dihydroflavonol-4-reductase
MGVVAVTGASGHIGGNLVRTLLEQGRRVRVLVRRDNRALEGLGVERIAGDVLDADSLKAFCRGAEVVYNLAAHITILRDDPRAMEVNVRGPRNVGRACLAAGVKRLVHFSSVHALKDHPLDEPITETRALADDSVRLVYNRSKAEGERALAHMQGAGLEIVTLNPTGVIGPFDMKLSPMGELIQQLATGRMPALVNAGYDFVDVRDVVASAITAEAYGTSGERYLLSGHYIHFSEMAKLIAAVTGVRPPWFTSPMWLARLSAPFATAVAMALNQRPKVTSASLEVLRGNKDIRHDKASAELGHHPRPMEETIADTIAWMRDAGLVPTPGTARGMR